ncbi:hypothetical protein ACF0H5_017148 [Mactra antiquata]
MSQNESGKLYKFVDNGKGRFNELSSDDNFPNKFLTFYVRIEADEFNKNDFLGRNKDKNVDVEKTYLSTRKVKDLEVTIEKIFKKKIIKQLEAMANFIKPIVPKDVGDIDYHLVHDTDQLFRKISAELFLPIPGILRNGKTRNIKPSRRFDRKTQSPTRPTLHPQKFQLKSICEKIEINVVNHLVDGLKKRFQLPVKILMQYLSKFAIFSVIYSNVQVHKQHIIVKKCLPPKLKKSCVDLMRRIENEVEEHIEYFESLKKMYYLLCGLLADYDKKWKVPSVHLTENVQKELLSLNKIYACGSYYGELTLFVTKPLTKSNKQRINKIVKGYRSRLIEIPELHAGPDIQTGFEIWFSVGDAMQSGSLGCFVNIQRQGVQETPKLHAVTCAHCAMEITDRDAYLDHEKQHILGRVSHYMYDPYRYDLATIEINDTRARYCEVRMPDYNMQNFNDWEIFYGEVAGKPVYKIGATSGLKKGVVVGDNISRRIIDDERELYIEHNILVATQSVLPASRLNVNQPAFSEEGDSGSAVCLVHNGRVHVAALLCGRLTDAATGFYMSFCTKIGPAIHCLERSHNINVTPARSPELPAPVLFRLGN